MNGGDDRIRTDDPLVANEVLSQLSYIPTDLKGWPGAPVRKHGTPPGGRHHISGAECVKLLRTRVMARR